MKRNSIAWYIGAGLAFAAAFATPSWGADRIYMTTVGMKQGTFVGEDVRPNFRNIVDVLKFGFDVSLPLSNGLPAGRRVYGPVRITKAVGPASVQFLTAAGTNESLKTVTIDFWILSQDGQERLARRLLLTNALVVGIEQYTEPDATGGPQVLEQISLSFQSYTLTDQTAGMTVHDELAIQ
jgi:type VI secretion system Hcp family effector